LPEQKVWLLLSYGGILSAHILSNSKTLATQRLRSSPFFIFHSLFIPSPLRFFGSFLQKLPKTRLTAADGKRAAAIGVLGAKGRKAASRAAKEASKSSFDLPNATNRSVTFSSTSCSRCRFLGAKSRRRRIRGNEGGMELGQFLPRFYVKK
jgi:hypothetical protein